jgi:hypothetical protein
MATADVEKKLLTNIELALQLRMLCPPLLFIAETSSYHGGWQVTKTGNNSHPTGVVLCLYEF